MSHPDTYICDVCGAEFPDKSRSVFTVYRDTIGLESGPKELEEPVYETVELDLCPSCIDRACPIRKVAPAYLKARYEFREGVR